MTQIIFFVSPFLDSAVDDEVGGSGYTPFSTHPFRHVTATSRASVRHFCHVTTSRAGAWQPTTSRHPGHAPSPPSPSERQQKPPDALKATSHPTSIPSSHTIRPHLVFSSHPPYTLTNPVPPRPRPVLLTPHLTPSLISPTHPLLLLTRPPIGTGCKSCG